MRVFRTQNMESARIGSHYQQIYLACVCTFLGGVRYPGDDTRFAYIETISAMPKLASIASTFSPMAEGHVQMPVP